MTPQMLTSTPKSEDGQFVHDVNSILHTHFGSSTQSARSVLCVFTLPSCSLIASAIDEATIVQAIKHGLASGWATRQVLPAAVASAVPRTHRGDQRGDGLSLSMQERLSKRRHKFFWALSWYLAGGETFASERACRP